MEYFEHLQELMGEKLSTNPIPSEVQVSKAVRPSQVQSQHKDTVTTLRSARDNNNENKTPAACTRTAPVTGGTMTAAWWITAWPMCHMDTADTLV